MSRYNPRLRWTLAIRKSDLDPTSRVIAYLLATFMNAEGFGYPGINAIAAGTGLDRRTVIRHLGPNGRLIREGWLRKERGGKGRSSRYQALIPERPKVPDPSSSNLNGDLQAALQRTFGERRGAAQAFLRAFLKRHDVEAVSDLGADALADLFTELRRG